MPFWSRKHAAPEDSHDATNSEPLDAQKSTERRWRRHSVRDFVSSLKRNKRRANRHGVQDQSPDAESPQPLEHSEAHPSPVSMLKRITSSKSRKDTQRVRKLSFPAQSPSPPVKEEEQEPEPIILHEDEVKALFSGAPQFAVASGHGRREVKASFPWDDEHSTNDMSDATPLTHPAFYAATLRRPLPNSSAAAARNVPEFDLGAIELPSMKDSQGFEVGSVGLDHFLGIAISDNQFNDDDENGKNGLSEAARTRELFHSTPEKLGIRRFDIAIVHERLVEVTEMYRPKRESESRATILENSSLGELYAILFGKFLTPPRFDPDTSDPTGLKVQIETLLRILKLKGIWYNFSLVEWRIRLGQLLWTNPEPILSEEEESDEPGLQWSERDLLLLQILLSCELYLRLDAISILNPSEIDQQLNLTSEEAKSISNMKNRKTDWDLVLARRFLQEIHVVEEVTSLAEPKKRTFFSSIKADPETTPPPPFGQVRLLPRNQARQLTGLAFFAASIEWPNLDNVFSDLSQKLELSTTITPPMADSLDVPANVEASSAHGTPLGTPRSTSARSSYFGTKYRSRPLFGRTSTQRSIQLSPSSASSDYSASHGPDNIGGWLSRAYLTGLIMPGDAICHLLMSTLLENDPRAVAALGDSASLYGGFAYGACSWWSAGCIVGKVLSATPEAKECMGWVMTKFVPAGFADGWADISYSSVPVDNRFENDDVALASNFVKGASGIEGTKVEEFRLPVEHTKERYRVRDAEIRFLGLYLEPIKEAHFKEPSPSAMLTENPLSPGVEGEIFTNGLFAASVRFSIPPTSSNEDVNPDLVDHGDAENPLTDRSDPHVHTLQLRDDVHFVSAYPCKPPTASKVSFLNLPPTLSEMTEGRDDSTMQLSAHPLHSSHIYRTVSVSALVDPDLDAALVGEALMQDNDGVIVIDASPSTDAAVLARAWCAEKGFHALIARHARTCLSCAVREASGLGIKVIIRVWMP